MCVSNAITSFLNISHLPNEILLASFSYLPASTLRALCTVCRCYKNLIGNDHRSQTQLAYDFFNYQHLSHISFSDICCYLKEDKLIVEIQNDLSVLHLTRQWASTLPWISTLSVTNCTVSLPSLLNLLKESQQLIALHLCDCELDSSCISHLYAIQHKESGIGKIPNFYFHNVQPKPGISLPDEFNSSSERIKVTSGENVYQETDLTLDQFKRQVSNQELTAEDVLKAFDSLKETLRAKIIESIWCGVLMDPFEQKRIPIGQIHCKVRKYIGENPHHPALRSYSWR